MAGSQREYLIGWSGLPRRQGGRDTRPSQHVLAHEPFRWYREMRKSFRRTLKSEIGLDLVFDEFRFLFVAFRFRLNRLAKVFPVHRLFGGQDS